MLNKNSIEIWQDVNAKPYLQIEHLSKSYDDITTLKDISFSIYQGEFFFLLGQSGCGKTTLLRTLAGFETLNSGRIILDGVDITNVEPYKRPVSMMFQSYALFPHMTVYQNIAFGLRQEDLPKKIIAERVEEALSLVQLTGYEDRKPDKLSGGQKQRAALARSLAKHPKLVLLDEPLTALDKNLRERMQFELVNIQEKVGITFISVTHNQEEAMTMATRMAVMENGIIRQIGEPRDIYEFPNSKYVAEFIGSINLFNGVVIDMDFKHIVIETAEAKFIASRIGAIPIGAKVTMAIRPEKIMMSRTKPENEKNCLQGIIKEIAYLGDVSIYYVQLPTEKTVMVTIPNLLRLSTTKFKWDDDIFLFWRASNSIVLTG